MARFGLYIHYPYCRRRCDYCDFAIALVPQGSEHNGAYADAVIAEISARAASFFDRELVSIYIGGGTPSLWPVGDLSRVVNHARAVFGARHLEEVTLEVNPIDCATAALKGWLGAGVTRLSIGVQSTSDAELRVLGRDHSMGDGASAIGAAEAAGFEHISADVIIGTPGSLSAGLESVRAVAALGPDHLSVYELTFEPGAPLGRAAARGEIAPRPEDELAELYRRVDSELAALGFEHYEISSYARPGARAVHNSLYWSGAEYLGVGSSAASYRRFEDGRALRETNIRSAARYLRRASDSTVDCRETIEAADAAGERLWLAMRTVDGAAATLFAGRENLRRWLVKNDLATLREGRIRPTLLGFLYADQIAARVVRYP